MATIAKIAGVQIGDMSKVSSVAKNLISKISGVDVDSAPVQEEFIQGTITQTGTNDPVITITAQYPDDVNHSIGLIRASVGHYDLSVTGWNASNMTVNDQPLPYYEVVLDDPEAEVDFLHELNIFNDSGIYFSTLRDFNDDDGIINNWAFIFKFPSS